MSRAARNQATLGKTGQSLPAFDYWMLFAACALLGTGVVMVASATLHRIPDAPFYFLNRHLFALLLRDRVYRARGNVVLVADNNRRFLSLYERETALGRPEYELHSTLLSMFKRRAEESSGRSAGDSGRTSR